jgi:hypothetical protein
MQDSTDRNAKDSGNLKDREICMAAVTRFPYALNYVPENLKEPEICIASGVVMLNKVPENMIVREMYLGTVKGCFESLEYRLKELIDYEMRLEEDKQ